MNFTSLFLFFFGAIGIFNSFLISLYFIIKKQKQQSNLLFGLLLLFLSERALRSLIYFFSPALPNFYSKSEAITFLFIGPFLLLYMVSIKNPASALLKKWKYYILIWIIIAIISHLLFPFKNDQVFWKKYVLLAINIQWLIHILLSGWILVKYLNSNTSKPTKKDPTNLWLSLLLLSVFILWLLYFFISFTYFVIGSITFSILFYSFFLFFVFNKKERKQIFIDDKKQALKKIDSVTEIQLLAKLESLMMDNKLYKNPNLKSQEIAKALNIPIHQLSQFLNDNLGKSFSVFINEYRIEEAKRIIQSNTKYTLDAIGNESGFNSKSTFYTTFKRIVGMTPSTFKDQL